MKNLSMMHNFLGQEVWHKTDEIFLSQGKYTVWILKKFNMKECNWHMKDLGMMHYFLGQEAWQRTYEIFLSQGKYTVDIKEVQYDKIQIHVYTDSDGFDKMIIIIIINK